MNAPRHLWSGDWRRESSESAQRIAELRDRADAPVEPPAAELPRSPAGSAAASVRAALRQTASALRNATGAVARIRAPKVRPALLLGLAMLISAGTAYAVVASLSGPDNRGAALQSSGVRQPAAQVRTRHAWLGVDTTSFAPTDGAMIVDVAPGSPADRAGLQPGDVITRVDNQSVQSPGDLESVLSRLQVGQKVQIDFQLGPAAYTTQATLAGRPAGP